MTWMLTQCLNRGLRFGLLTLLALTLMGCTGGDPQEVLLGHQSAIAELSTKHAAQLAERTKVFEDKIKALTEKRQAEQEALNKLEDVEAKQAKRQEVNALLEAQKVEVEALTAAYVKDREHICTQHGESLQAYLRQNSDALHAALKAVRVAQRDLSPEARIAEQSKFFNPEARAKLAAGFTARQECLNKSSSEAMVVAQRMIDALL